MHTFNPLSPSPSALCRTCGKRQSSPMHGEESEVRGAKSEAENINLGSELVREISKCLFVAAEVKRELPPKGYKPHPFIGRSDRDCEVCGYSDRNPVHKIEVQIALVEEEHRLTESLIEAVAQLITEIERPSHVCPTCPTSSNDAHFEYCLLGRLAAAYRNLKATEEKP